MTLVSLRWRYRLHVDVEDTRDFSRSKGFSVRELEGQSRTFNDPYPLNQIEIKGADFGSNVKVVVSPRSTQIYFSINNLPEVKALENILDNLDKVEQILNEITIFFPDESVRFGIETRRSVMTDGMLKTWFMLKEELNKGYERLYDLILREASLVPIFLVQGKIGYAVSRLYVLSAELSRFQQDLIQLAKEQDIGEADKWESLLKEMTLESERFEAELASARTPVEFANIFDKYVSKAFSGSH
jgi:hypothetical protein